MKTGLLASDQILRIEGLGDNCELGFVLRGLGCEAGSLFRWAAIKPEQLLSKLRANFEGMYEFSNLQPFDDDMVVDAKYGVGWHSEMRSRLVDGHRVFLLDEAKRRKFYGVEKHKIRYLHAKFVARAQLGGLVFVIKSNDGMDAKTVDDIFEAISDLAAGARFALLEVQSTKDASLIGTVKQRRTGLLRGYVSRFLVRADPNPPDMEAWTSVLETTLGMFACPDWSKRIAQLHIPGAKIDLAFPPGGSGDGATGALSDPRVVVATLQNGNAWCRQVDTAFRLHGAEPGAAGTKLSWKGVRISEPCHLYGVLSSPVKDSLPVDVAMVARDENETVIAEWRTTVTPDEPADIALVLTAGKDRRVNIELVAQASRPIKSGERAVIDVSPLLLEPTAPSIKRSSTPSARGAAEPRSTDYWQRYARAADNVIRPVPDTDHVFQQECHNLSLYHFNGLSALRTIVTGLTMYDVRMPRSFLDFGCAYGRALRYFKAAFPEAKLTACDLRADAVAYCAATFGATPVISAEDFAKVQLPHQHDVIWLGSVFTHFDAKACTTLLEKMLGNLADGGLLVFSLHGRIYPQEVQPNRWKLLDDKAFAIANAQYEAEGFGYHDYPGRPGVGASLTSPTWVFEHLRARRDVVFAYQERAWTGWHDVAYVHKTSAIRSAFDLYKDRPY